MGEHLTLQVKYVEVSGDGAAPAVVGALLTRRDGFAEGVPQTLMLWQRLPLHESPLQESFPALSRGELWIAQRELYFGGAPGVVWSRQDGSPVVGPGPLRHGDTLRAVGDGDVVTVEH